MSHVIRPSLFTRTRERLSGVMRCRRQAITGRVLLRVEVVVEVSDFFPCPPPPGHDADAWRAKERAKEAASWHRSHSYLRDATVSDMLADQAITVTTD